MQGDAGCAEIYNGMQEDAGGCRCAQAARPDNFMHRARRVQSDCISRIFSNLVFGLLTKEKDMLAWAWLGAGGKQCDSIICSGLRPLTHQPLLCHSAGHCHRIRQVASVTDVQCCPCLAAAAWSRMMSASRWPVWEYADLCDLLSPEKKPWARRMRSALMQEAKMKMLKNIQLNCVMCSV